MEEIASAETAPALTGNLSGEPPYAARIAVSAVFAVFGILVGSWLPHLPDVKQNIGGTDAMIGQALLCSGFGAVVSMQLMGSLIHRYGSRNTSFFGGVVACLLVPLLLTHRSLPLLCVNLFILGLGYGVLDVGMNAHAMEVQRRFPRPIIASVHGWFSFGGIIGGLGAALAAKLHTGAVSHLAVTSAILLVVLAVSRKHMLPSGADQDTEGPKFMIPRGFLLVLGIMCAAAFVVEGGLLDWSAIYVREHLRADAVYGGIITGVCSGAMALGRFLGDPILRRYGNRVVAMGGGALCTGGILAAVSVPSLWVCMAGFAVASFGLANVVPTIFNQGGRIPGIPTGVGVVAITTCGYGGFLLGPPVIGMISTKVTLATGLATLALLGVIIMLGAIRFTEPATEDPLIPSGIS
jgi:fucose permease